MQNKLPSSKFQFLTYYDFEAEWQIAPNTNTSAKEGKPVDIWKFSDILYLRAEYHFELKYV